MTGEERKALAFVAILLGLSAVARAVNRPDAVRVTGASAVSIEDRLAANQQVHKGISRATSSPRKPAKTPARVPSGAGVVIDNRPPRGTPPPLLDLNRATAAQLDALPGISPAVAQRIVEYRTSLGRFSNVEQLDSVKGIGPKLLEKIRPRVSVR